MTQLESLITSTEEKCYMLTVNGCGGEHTIGFIDIEAATYWKKNDEIFQEYMFSWDRNEVVDKYNIPEKYQLKDWNEIDDLAHLNGPEFVKDYSLINVLDEEGEPITEINITEDMIEVDEEPLVSEDIKNKVAVVYGQQWNKGTFYFGPIETEETFDSSKLKISCSRWQNLIIISQIEYEDRIYYPEDNTTGKSQIIYFA